MGALISTAILAAAMSTLDGLLVAIAASVGNDLVPGKGSVWANRGVLLFLGVATIAGALNPPALVLLLGQLGIYGLVAASAGPLLAALYSRGTPPVGAAFASAGVALAVHFGLCAVLPNPAVAACAALLVAVPIAVLPALRAVPTNDPTTQPDPGGGVMRATSDWLTTHARFRPDAEAVVCVPTNRRWTYRQLARDAKRWAGKLQQHGVVAGDRVAMLAHNSGDHFLLMFACAELGATFFPMNWRLAPEELAWQLGNCEPRVLLTDASFRAVLDHESLALEDGPGELEGKGPGSDLDAPWVLMYTSGSSGRPKGALLTHRQVNFNAREHRPGLRSDPERTRTLTFTPLFHTGGLNCLSTPLLQRGGRVVVLTKRRGRAPGPLPDRVRAASPC